ncbi:MAG TPA: hypothetical protein PLS67_06550 [Accumulibacter sp.]|nr:hypothetical protein [Accumulibacter sp.]
MRWTTPAAARILLKVTESRNAVATPSACLFESVAGAESEAGRRAG